MNPLGDIVVKLCKIDMHQNSGEVRFLALRLRLAAVAARQVEAGPGVPAQPLRRQVPVCDAPLRRRAGGPNAQRDVAVSFW